MKVHSDIIEKLTCSRAKGLLKKAMARLEYLEPGSYSLFLQGDTIDFAGIEMSKSELHSLARIAMFKRKNPSWNVDEEILGTFYSEVRSAHEIVNLLKDVYGLTEKDHNIVYRRYVSDVLKVAGMKNNTARRNIQGETKAVRVFYPPRGLTHIDCWAIYLKRKAAFERTSL